MDVSKEIAKDTFQPTALCNACTSRFALSAGIIHIYVQDLFLYSEDRHYDYLIARSKL